MSIILFITLIGLYWLFGYETLKENNKSYQEELYKIWKENERLNKNYERIYNENCKLREQHNITDISLLDENERLNNIINELEKHCETMLSIFEQMTDEQRQEQLDKYKIYDDF